MLVLQSAIFSVCLSSLSRLSLGFQKFLPFWHCWPFCSPLDLASFSWAPPAPWGLSLVWLFLLVSHLVLRWGYPSPTPPRLWFLGAGTEGGTALHFNTILLFLSSGLKLIWYHFCWHMWVILAVGSVRLLLHVQNTPPPKVPCREQKNRKQTPSVLVHEALTRSLTPCPNLCAS